MPGGIPVTTWAKTNCSVEIPPNAVLQVPCPWRNNEPEESLQMLRLRGLQEEKTLCSYPAGSHPSFLRLAHIWRGLPPLVGPWSSKGSKGFESLEGRARELCGGPRSQDGQWDGSGGEDEGAGEGHLEKSWEVGWATERYVSTWGVWEVVWFPNA